MYYKISEEDLLNLMKAAYMLECIKSYYPDFDVEFQEAFDDMPADEDIAEAINCVYELI